MKPAAAAVTFSPALLSPPQLGVLVLADSRDAATTTAFTREQASKRDIEDLGEQCP